MATKDFNTQDEATPAPMENSVTARRPVDKYAFESIHYLMDEILTSATGLQGIAKLMASSNENDEVSYAVHALGQQLQSLRNQTAEALKPVFEAFDQPAIEF